MNFNDLLRKHDIAPETVLVLRHRPMEPILRKALPWLAAERPDLFRGYQQAQFPKAEAAFTRAKYIASYIGVEAGTALFAGLYSVNSSQRITSEEYWTIPSNKELHEVYGMGGFSRDRGGSTPWFELGICDTCYPEWRGRLIIRWPGLERSWWRWADRNTFVIDAIREVSGLIEPVPKWNELVMTWPELNLKLTKWQTTMKEWRGIYFVFDSSDGKGYVGAACGEHNIYGRWSDYAKTGHGGNQELRNRDPRNFRFSILQLVAQDMPPEEVGLLEKAWKDRLHTREFGLNGN